MNGSRLLDKISTKTLLSNVNMLSVNQLNAQIKITEVWKALNDTNRPLKVEKVVQGKSNCLTRAVATGNLKEFGKTSLVQSTFLSDASKVWNKCPNSIKECDTVWKAKKSIRTFVQSLPI